MCLDNRLVIFGAWNQYVLVCSNIHMMLESKKVTLSRNGLKWDVVNLRMIERVKNWR